MICSTLAIGRITAYWKGHPRLRRCSYQDDEAVLAQLRQIWRERGSCCDRRPHQIVHHAFGTELLRKRIQRVMWLYGLALLVRGVGALAADTRATWSV